MEFDCQPRLLSDKLELRPLAVGDFDELFEVASDPLIWEQHPSHDRWMPGPFRTYFDDSIASAAALVIADRATGELIGSARFHGYDPAASEVEIGWIFLARSRWGGVWAADVMKLLLAHAFGTVSHVVWLAGLDNVRSQRAAERLGARAVGERPDAGGTPSTVFRFVRTS